MKIGVVIPVFSNFKGSIEALESIRTKHDWEPIVRPQWRVNLALSRAWNQGIEEALFKRGCDFALVINDDIIFAPCTIDNIVDFWEKYAEEKKVVLASAVNVASFCPEPLDILTILDRMPEYLEQEGNYAEHPDYSCFLVNKTLFETMGRFDENFVPAYFEDNDSHYRINLSGNIAVCVNNAPYYHLGSQTEKDAHFHNQFETNRNYYGLKWGGQPPNETFNTPWNDPALTHKDWT